MDREPAPDTAKIDHMLNHWIVDCRRLEAVIVEMAFYRRGELIEDHFVPADQQVATPVMPGTRQETLLAAGCLIAKGRHVDTVP
jgi:hypothetical protein